MTYFAQQAINAIQLGSIYALIALGYSMVYGVLTMINFAHGDIFMVGAFFCLLLASVVSLPFPVTLVMVMLATGPDPGVAVARQGRSTPDHGAHRHGRERRYQSSPHRRRAPW